ncbi:MAG TPA: hypothetical protein DCY03_28440 [Planctomycetaceae bacterium]|nr:hypothetical protein [Planctomycetaceae bacterium]|tara:strand:+ start:2246 stop:2524 length:279 start_codon:yes stop_codon:yes gene_type:complete
MDVLLNETGKGTFSSAKQALFTSGYFDQIQTSSRAHRLSQNYLKSRLNSAIDLVKLKTGILVFRFNHGMSIQITGPGFLFLFFSLIAVCKML